MTTLAAGWENMGGRTLKRAVDNRTISHPLNGPLPAQTDPTGGAYSVSDWFNSGADDFPSNLGAETANNQTANTLAEAFAVA